MSCNESLFHSINTYRFLHQILCKDKCSTFCEQGRGTETSAEDGRNASITVAKHAISPIVEKKRLPKAGHLIMGRKDGEKPKKAPWRN
jgi:hypothetical protein